MVIHDGSKWQTAGRHQGKQVHSTFFIQSLERPAPLSPLIIATCICSGIDVTVRVRARVRIVKGNKSKKKSAFSHFSANYQLQRLSCGGAPVAIK